MREYEWEGFFLYYLLWYARTPESMIGIDIIAYFAIESYENKDSEEYETIRVHSPIEYEWYSYLKYEKSKYYEKDYKFVHICEKSFI